MMNYNKDEVTIFLPCYNEEMSLRSVVESFKNAGFKNIIIVDDASTDRTVKIAKSLNVEVHTNYTTTTLELAILKGIYNVKTTYALMFVSFYYDELINRRALEQFVEFGIIGNYSLLFSKDESGKSKDISLIIKRKYGIFFPEPLFGVVFFDERIIDLIKSDVGGTGQYLYLEIIKEAIDHKLKIGSYSLRLSKHKIESFRGLIAWMLHKKLKPADAYFKYAVPDNDKKEIKKEVSIAMFGYIIIRLVELATDYFAK